MPHYEKFDLPLSARMAMNYLTRMVDARYDNLPYWLIAAHENPAFAKHLRVDDAELVASWYEAAVAVRQMLNTGEAGQVEASFRRHLMKSWGPMGLRYHAQYPWTKTIHSSFHEMAYVLSALNRMVADDPQDRQAEKRAASLVRGLRKLVVQRKKKIFWSGDFEEPDTLYEFPNDVYTLKDGWDLSCHSGRGEHCIRNGVLLHPLVVRYDLTGDEVALDLAKGMANHLLGVSRYFNWKMEFTGHVHSTMWVASGLIRLGRLTKTPRYIEKGRKIYDYVRSLSSSYGWIPEYTQWKPMSEEHCETCCIKDGIECAAELIDAGHPEYYEDLIRFSRNQLMENQIRDGCFIAVDNSKPDTEQTTWRDIDKRAVGGWSGGSCPNSISLKRFRSIAGCCVGTAPQAMLIVWDRSASYSRGRLTVNVPLDKTADWGRLSMEYPNEGRISVTPRRRCDVAIRLHSWMGKSLTGTINGHKARWVMEGPFVVFKGVPAGATASLCHPIRTRRVTEIVQDRRFTALYRGPDVIDLLPHGEPLRLYQRVLGKKKVYPKAPKTLTGGAEFVAAPTEQKQ